MKINKIFLFSHSNFIQDKMCKQVWMESRRLFLFQSDYKHMKIIGRMRLRNALNHTHAIEKARVADTAQQACREGRRHTDGHA
jgi:hypothetical protein